MTEYHSTVELGKVLLSQGRNQEEILEFLSDSGFSLIDAIKATRAIFSTSLQDAKEICVQSKLWNETVRAAEPLHRDIEALFRKKDN